MLQQTSDHDQHRSDVHC